MSGEDVEAHREYLAEVCRSLGIEDMLGQIWSVYKVVHGFKVKTLPRIEAEVTAKQVNSACAIAIALAGAHSDGREAQRGKNIAHILQATLLTRTDFTDALDGCIRANDRTRPPPLPAGKRVLTRILAVMRGVDVMRMVYYRFDYAWDAVTALVRKSATSSPTERGATSQGPARGTRLSELRSLTWTLFIAIYADVVPVTADIVGLNALLTGVVLFVARRSSLWALDEGASAADAERATAPGEESVLACLVRHGTPAHEVLHGELFAQRWVKHMAACNDDDALVPVWRWHIPAAAETRDWIERAGLVFAKGVLRDAPPDEAATGGDAGQRKGAVEAQNPAAHGDAPTVLRELSRFYDRCIARSLFNFDMRVFLDRQLYAIISTPKRRGPPPRKDVTGRDLFGAAAAAAAADTRPFETAAGPVSTPPSAPAPTAPAGKGEGEGEDEGKGGARGLVDSVSVTSLSDRRRAHQWLLQVLLEQPEGPSDALQRLFDQCNASPMAAVGTVVDQVTARVHSVMEEAVKDGGGGEAGGAVVAASAEPTAATRAQHADTVLRNWPRVVFRLFYASLHGILEREVQQAGPEHGRTLLASREFLFALAACACEVVFFIDNLRFLCFPTLLDTLRLDPFDLFKVIETFVRCTPGLPQFIRRHMSEVEGAILGWAGWAVDSKLWRHLDEAREVLRSRAGREAARGARKRLRASVDPSRPAIGEAQSILDADASIHDARSGNLLRELAPRSVPHGTLLSVFFRKVVQYTVSRVRACCAALGLGGTMEDEVWTGCRYALEHVDTLLKGRHVDVVVLCTIYGICKSHDPRNTSMSFRAMVGVYRGLEMPFTSKTQVVRDIRISENPQHGIGTIIDYYNITFVPVMKMILLNLPALVAMGETAAEETQGLWQSKSSLSVPEDIATLPSVSAQVDAHRALERARRRVLRADETYSASASSLLRTLLTSSLIARADRPHHTPPFVLLRLPTHESLLSPQRLGDTNVYVGPLVQGTHAQATGPSTTAAAAATTTTTTGAGATSGGNGTSDTGSGVVGAAAQKARATLGAASAAATSTAGSAPAMSGYGDAPVPAPDAAHLRQAGAPAARDCVYRFDLALGGMAHRELTARGGTVRRRQSAAEAGADAAGAAISHTATRTGAGSAATFDPSQAPPAAAEGLVTYPPSVAAAAAANGTGTDRQLTPGVDGMPGESGHEHPPAAHIPAEQRKGTGASTPPGDQEAREEVNEEEQGAARKRFRAASAQAGQW